MFHLVRQQPIVQIIYVGVGDGKGRDQNALVEEGFAEGLVLDTVDEQELVERINVPKLHDAQGVEVHLRCP